MPNKSQIYISPTCDLSTSLVDDMERFGAMELRQLGGTSEVSLKLESLIVAKKKEEDNYFLGITCMLVCIVGYTIMSFFTKVLYIVNPSLGPWDVMLSRSVLATIFIGLQAKVNGVNLVQFKNYGAFLVCAVGIRTFCYFVYLMSSKYISVTKATLIMYSNPMVIVVLAYFFLKENITKYDILCIFTVMAGCVLMTQNGDQGQVEESAFGYLLAIMSCVTMGVGLTMTRVINQVLNPMVFVFYYSFFMLVVSLAVLFTTDVIQLRNYSFLDVFLLFLVAVGGVIGAQFSGIALKYLEATKIGPFWHLEIVLLCILEGLLLNYEFAFTDLLGGALIISTLILSILTRKSKTSE